MGYDPRLPQDLAASGLDPNTLQSVLGILRSYIAPVAYDGMPVQDAVNFATYILRTTIGMSTFETGTPSCGGPLQVAVILPTTGFKWVQKLELSVEAI